MAIQYKPTKQKKEKSAKAPKAPKEPKAIKIGSATQMKTAKPAKAPKAPKAPKPEKVKAFAPAFKGGKVEKVADLEKKSVLKKNVNPVVAGSVVLAMIVVAIVLVMVVMPAMEKRGEEISGIAVSRMPEKTVYRQGEEPDYEGLRITVTRNNGETFVVGPDDCKITGFDDMVPYEKLFITVEYQGFTDSFPVEIKEKIQSIPVLKSIRLEPMPQTEYKDGEWLNTDGAYIVREYVDGTKLPPLNLLRTHVWGWDKVNGPGTYTLTVKYSENGVLRTFDYEITVTE